MKPQSVSKTRSAVHYRHLLRVSYAYAARTIEENGSYVPVLMAH